LRIPEASRASSAAPKHLLGGFAVQYEEETTIWEGHPSHIKDLGFNVVCVLLSPLVFPLFAMLWRYLETKKCQYEITTERLRMTTGILSKRMDELELYRVKDSSIDQPFFLRIFKRANVVINTSDASTPRITLIAIEDARAVRENLRGCVEKMRDRKRVREVDYS
jgi:uncharacterized membrane protein YdbT with pleckstrin-like domain